MKLNWILSAWLTVFFCLLSAPAQAIVMLFSDYDNTITKDREQGNWITLYELHRVHATAHSSIPIPLDLPKVILISHQDWEAYESQLARGEGQTGQPLPVPLYYGESKNGKHLDQFVPGFYQKVGSLTYHRYRGDEYFDSSIPNPINYWRLDRKAAVARTKKGQGTHKGYGFDLMAHFLSDPHLAAGFRLVTARGYPDEAIQQVFKDMRKEGEIKLLPFINPTGRPLSYWALGHPQFANRWSTENTGIKKQGVVLEAANQWRMTPAIEQVLNPDGTHMDHYHTFILQEDNPEYVQKWVELAQDLTRRGTHFIKFIIRHSGSLEEVEANEFWVSNRGTRTLERDIVIKSDGSFRRAYDHEMYITHILAKEANGRLLNACERLLNSKTSAVKEKR